jgi:hypothetical protein
MKTTTQEQDMTTTITDNDFARALKMIVNEWDRCIAIHMEKGMTKKQAAAIVGPQMTDWMDENTARYNKEKAA